MKNYLNYVHCLFPIPRIIFNHYLCVAGGGVVLAGYGTGTWGRYKHVTLGWVGVYRWRMATCPQA